MQAGPAPKSVVLSLYGRGTVDASLPHHLMTRQREDNT